VLPTAGTKTVFFAEFKTNCCPRASTMSGKDYARTDEKPDDRTETDYS